MPVTSVTSDPEGLTLTLVGDYAVPLARLWDAWVDPRRIERFWGPPGWPARFTRHDMAVGGESHYVMTCPDGAKAPGYWRYRAVEAMAFFEIVDGFAGDHGAPDDDMPSTIMRVDFEATAATSTRCGVPITIRR